jgi:predicted HTH transcriptional regulator
LIEQWGSGIPGIFNEVRANNWPEPEIEEIANRVRCRPVKSLLFSAWKANQAQSKGLLKTCCCGN